MEFTIIYEDIKDKEYIQEILINSPVYVHFIDFNTALGRKEAYRIKSHWGAKANPFVTVKDDDGNILKVFYSEDTSAVQQLIKWFYDSEG